MASPGGTYTLSPYVLLLQPFTTGSPPQPVLPSLFMNLSRPVFILVGLAAPVVGTPIIAPATGTSTYYVTPAGLAGNSAMVQALVLDPSTANAFYAASDGYEIVFK